MKQRSIIRALVVLCLVAAMATGAALASEHPLLDEARQEGKAIFYANITGVDAIMEAFEAEYGVVAEYTRISTAVYIPTVQTEFQAGRLAADVLQGPLPVLQILKDAGILEAYVSPVSENYPEWSKDPDGVIQQFGIETVALIYNKELVDPADVPTSYKDLAWLVGLKDHVFETEAEWMDFLRGLAANRPMFVASFGPTPGPIETGEKHIGISMPKYIVTRAPAPLDWAKLDGEPLMGSARGIALAKGAQRPNAAKLFVDYWLSEASATLLATDVGETVLYEGIYPPIEGIAEPELIALRELSDDEIQEWSEVFQTIF